MTVSARPYLHRRSAHRSGLLCLLLCLTAPAAAGVFGDGDPANGPEDDRRGISDGQGEAPGNEWFRSAGTITATAPCGGSATLLDLRALAPDQAGAVVVTAAHVLYDLDRGQPWTNCAFHHLGLGQLPGYQAPLRRDRTLAGAFDPAADPSAADSGKEDWAFTWLGPDWRPPGGAPGLVPATALSVADGTGRLGLVAWDRRRGEVSVALGCRAIFSGPGDLGGGAWPGQLLDDCDSDTGASGGAIVVGRGSRSLLIGIRGGTHWDRERWPADGFPAGPPDGTRWDPARHTNYARALDQRMLEELGAWLRRLPKPSPGP